MVIGSATNTPHRRKQGDGEADRPERYRRTIQSVERAIDILETLSMSGDEMKLNEIASSTDLNVSTCHHLLTTLVERGYAGQNPRQRTYYIGHKVLELSTSRFRQIDLLDLSVQELRRLNAETSETVYLASLQGQDLVNLAKLDSTHAVRVDSGAIAKSSAAHATATGKAILAWLPEQEVARLVGNKGLTKFTDKTITSLGDLMEHLRLVRRNGYASDWEEFQPGVICLASAIRDHSGAVIGSIGCSLPTMRADEAHMSFLTDQVRLSARQLSERLGSKE